MTISLHREGFIADDIKYINNTSVEREMFSLETEFEVYSGEFRQFLIEIQTLMAEMDYRRMQIEDLKLRAESNANTIAEISQQYLGDQKNYEVLSIEDSLKNFKELYTIGLQKYHVKHYEEAIQIFKKILTYNTYHLLASNCQYWIGECYNMLGDYPKAIEAYQLVFEYPLSNKFDNTLFMSGLCYIKLGNRQIAEAYFKELFNRYPDSVYTSKVRQYLGNL